MKDFADKFDEVGLRYPNQAEHDRAVEQLEQLLGEAIDDVLSKDLNWLIDTESGFTIHFLPEHVKDRLKQEARGK